MTRRRVVNGVVRTSGECQRRSSRAPVGTLALVLVGACANPVAPSARYEPHVVTTYTPVDTALLQCRYEGNQRECYHE